MAYSRRRNSRKRTMRTVGGGRYGGARVRNGNGKFIVANGSGETKKWWSCPTPSITADCTDVTDQENIRRYQR